MRAAAGSAVRGTLVRGLTDGDLWRLDCFEGGEYRRVGVGVRVLDGGEEVRAETYVWVAGEEELESGEWDFETFRREKMRAWVGGGDQEFAGEWRRAEWVGVGGWMDGALADSLWVW